LNPKVNSKEALQLLTTQIEAVIAPMGYEVVALELTVHGERILRLSIDFLDQAHLAEPTKRIGLNDCIAVNSAVDLLLEETPHIEGAYHLEVSSPGVERPLRKKQDFERFKGQRVRISTYRPLEANELKNSHYWEKNKKQKNFIGELVGVYVDGNHIQIKPEGYKGGAEEFEGILIPLDLVTKANLEFTNP